MKHRTVIPAIVIAHADQTNQGVNAPKPSVPPHTPVRIGQETPDILEKLGVTMTAVTIADVPAGANLRNHLVDALRWHVRGYTIDCNWQQLSKIVSSNIK